MTQVRRQFGVRLGLIGLMAGLVASCGADRIPHAPALTPVAPPMTAQQSPEQSQVTTLIVKRRTEAGPESDPRTFAAKYGVTLRPHQLNVLGIEAITLAPGRDPVALREQMAADPGIEYAELPQVVRLLPVEAAATAPLPQKGKMGTDPLRSRQYALDRLRIEGAHQVTSGSVQTMVAVVDTGIDARHPDLAGRVLPGFTTVPVNPPGADDHGHGTFAAGLIAAQVGNGRGIAGVSPQVSLLPVKVFDAHGEGTDLDVATGIVWSALQGADVITLSARVDRPSGVLQAALAFAVQRKAVVVTAANGVISGEPGVIAVGATTRAGKPLGERAFLSAPGEALVSTLPTGSVSLNSVFGLPLSYGTLTGPGTAAPMVAGLAALLKSEAPKLTSAQVKAKLEAAANKGQVDATRTLTAK